LIFGLLCHDLKNQTDLTAQEQRPKKEGGLPCGFAQGKKSRPYTGRHKSKSEEKKQIHRENQRWCRGPNPPKSGGFGMTNLRIGMTRGANGRGAKGLAEGRGGEGQPHLYVK
jgi:hypothetical protein